MIICIVVNGDFDLDPTMPIIKSVQVILIYYNVFEFHFLRLISTHVFKTYMIILALKHLNITTHLLGFLCIVVRSFMFQRDACFKNFAMVGIFASKGLTCP